MDRDEETRVEAEDQQNHSEASFERWLDSRIANDTEANVLWTALREMLTAELEEGAQITASALYGLLLVTLKTLLAEHEKLARPTHKGHAIKTKALAGVKKNEEAHAIDADQVKEAMRDHTEQLNAMSMGRIAAAARLLHLCLIKLPESVVWNTLASSVPVLEELLKESLPQTILIPALSSFSVLFCHVPAALSATNPKLIAAFSMALKLVITGKPKVRKRAIRTVHVLLCHFKARSTSATTATYDLLCKSVNKIVESGFLHVSGHQTTVALYTLELIKRTIHDVPVSMQKSWCTQCLTLPSLCSPTLTQCVFLAFQALFDSSNEVETKTHDEDAKADSKTSSKPEEDDDDDEESSNHKQSSHKLGSLPTEAEKHEPLPKLEKARQQLYAHLINSIFQAQPAALDIPPTEAFCAALAEGICTLNRFDDPQAALAKQLPKLFSSVVPIFKTGNPKTSLAALMCLKRVISESLTDDFLDKDLAKVEADGTPDAVKDTVLRSIVDQLVPGLQITYHESWDEMLQICAVFFERLGASTLTPARLVNRQIAADRQASNNWVIEELLNRIATLRETDQRMKKRVDPVLKHALLAIGITDFLKYFPIAFPNPATGDMEGQNLWLISFFRENLSHAHLNYFYNEMIPSANMLHALSTQFTKNGRELAAKHLLMLHNQVWSLFPRFCYHPRDLADSFSMIAETIGLAIQDKPEIRVELLHGLTSLINRTSQAIQSASKAIQDFSEAHPELTSSRGMSVDNLENLLEISQTLQDRHDELVRDLDAIKPFSQNFLPLLFNIYVSQGSAEEKMALQACIEAFLTISSPELINEFYRTILSTILTTTPGVSGSTEGDDEKLQVLQSLTNLSVAFVPYLSGSNLELLFKTIRPNLHRASRHAKPVDFTLQKKSWKVVRAICEKGESDFAKSHMSEIQGLLTAPEIVGTSKISVVKAMVSLMEPDQLQAWLQGQDKSFSKFIVSGSSRDSLPTPMPAIVLGWRDVSTKTRQSASATLEAIGKSIGAERLIAILVVGLTSQDESFKAATISCFTLIIQRFSKELASIKNGQQFQQLLHTATLLLNLEGSEIKGATIALIRAMIAPSPVFVLQNALPAILKTILNWPDPVKTKFMRDIRFLLEKFIRRLEYDTVAEMMPKQHIKFLQNINQRYLHAKKKKNADGNKPKRHDSDDEFGGSDDESGARSSSSMQVDQAHSKRGKKAGALDQAWLMEDVTEGGGPIDFADPNANRSVVTVDPSILHRQSKPTSNPFRTGADGRMIISDSYRSSKGSDVRGGIVSDEVIDALEDDIVSKKRKRARDAQDSDDESRPSSSNAMQVSSAPEKKPWYDSKGFRDQVGHKRAKLDPSQSAKSQVDTYRSKRAGGDMKRTGQKVDPHAYVKPNPAFLNKRHRSQSVQQYEHLIGKKKTKK
jgi:ribosomal RNA-processing protein 12